MFKKYKNDIKELAIYLIIISSIFVSYIQFSLSWVPTGGLHVKNFYFEIPLVLFISLLLYFPEIKNKLIRYIAPATPITIIYIYFDVFYNFLERSIRPSDIKNINTIFDFSTEISIYIIFSSFIIAYSLFLLLSQAYNTLSFKSFSISIACRFLIALITTSILSSGLFMAHFTKSYDYLDWSQQKSISYNGRFSSFIYYGNQEKQNLIQLHKYKSYKNINIQNRLYPGILKNNKNIHFIVLESFIDPRLINGVEFQPSPLSPKIKPYLNNQTNFSRVISPVYGGGTAQAEFELLTGVKALAKVDSVEFNVMTGKKISSFVNHLKNNHYKTIATIGSTSEYFNSPKAYKSLGFDEVLFLEESSTIKKNKDDAFIFDGDVLEYNFEKIKNIIAKDNSPVFNYVLGMYGHFPYERNIKVRPKVIKVNHEDKRVHRVANQFFYRTKEIAIYINNIISIDPNAIIYVTSDHLPPLIGGTIDYNLDKHINISILIDANKSIELKQKKYFEIPWIIWDLLLNIQHERSLDDSEMETLYFKTLSESL